LIYNGAGNKNPLPILQDGGQQKPVTHPTLIYNGAGNKNPLPILHFNGGQQKPVTHPTFVHKPKDKKT